MDGLAGVNGTKAFSFYDDEDGYRETMLITRLAGYPFFFGIELNESVFYARTMDAAWRTIMASFAALLVFIGIIAVTIRRAIRPLDAI